MPIAGYDGAVLWGTYYSDVTSDFWDGILSDVGYRTHAWGMDVGADTLDTTDFTSEGWREFKAGLKSWTGTIEMYVDSDTQIQESDVGGQAYLRLFLNANQVLKGEAHCIGQSPSVTVDGIETQTLTFQGTSDLFHSDIA